MLLFIFNKSEDVQVYLLAGSEGDIIWDMM